MQKLHKKACVNIINFKTISYLGLLEYKRYATRTDANTDLLKQIPLWVSNIHFLSKILFMMKWTQCFFILMWRNRHLMYHVHYYCGYFRFTVKFQVLELVIGVSIFFHRMVYFTLHCILHN